MRIENEAGLNSVIHRMVASKFEGQKPGADLTVTSVNTRDSLEISKEGSAKSKNACDEQYRMNFNIEEFRRQLENARKQGEAYAEESRTRSKCFLIAMRIMKGDDVPRADYAYLAEKDLALFSKAVTLRMTNEHPQKHKRVSEDEKPKSHDSEDNAAEVKNVQPSGLEIVFESNVDTGAAEANAESG